MRIVALGLSHHTASIELRDHVAVPAQRLPEALGCLRSRLGKGVILSTCNRSEVYALAPTTKAGVAALTEMFAECNDLTMEDLEPHLYAYSGREAVRHLFRVASGLDSLILGEAQILGQVRDAYAASSRAGMAGGVMTRLFHQALRVGKRARRETAIGRNALSISRAAVELARRTLGGLSDKRVLVIGVGDAGKLAARALSDAGVAEITVANRTYQRAVELAAELNGRAASLDDLPRLLEEADIAISATGSPGYLLTPELVARARVASDRPLFIADIAAPRDVDPAVKSFAGVHLYDIDDLEAVAETNRRARQAEARKVEEMVSQEVRSFMDWLRSLDAVPTVAAMYQRADAVREEELARALRLMPSLAEADQATLDAFSRALVKKLLHRPAAALKTRKDPSLTEAAQELFGLEQ
ncbi:MAG: glutamyl-tRNA reductase [Chloroflexi bacterium]|nr:glutamyl-tRNA reductase [Chloroflexota bacterium]